MTEIKSINELLGMELDIPDYQRPYKWTIQNIEDLLSDISNSITDAEMYRTFKYRIGTIILHKNDNGRYDVVDGQQRIISLTLLKHCIEPDYTCSILEKDFTNKTTQLNIHRNYNFIREWFSLKSNDIKNDFIHAIDEILEVVVICVDKVSEAFQLFDSQNTRGKALDPHDLLKAYHLREMKKYPYEMEHAVTKWEAKDTKQIRELFDLYLFPIWNWSRGIKSKSFTANEIDTYKGIAETSMYTYARRASKAMPYFQITEPFIAGNDFFEMVDHYLNLLQDIKTEMENNMAYGKSFSNNYLEQKRVNNHDASTYMCVKSDFEPIVSEEEWYKCQEIKAKRVKQTMSAANTANKQKRHHGTKENRDLWGSKLQCSCGHSFRKNRWHKNNNMPWSYGYQCYNQLNNGSAASRRKAGVDDTGYCDQPMIADWKLDLMAKFIFERIWIDKNEVISKTCDLINECYRADVPKKVNLTGVASQIEKYRAKKNNLLDMRTDGEITKEEFAVQKQKIDAVLADLENEYASMLQSEQEIRVPDLRWDEIKETLTQVLDFSQPQVNPDLIRKFVSKIVPDGKNHFRWYMNLDGHDTTSLDVVTEGRKSNAVVTFDSGGDKPPLHTGDVITISQLKEKKSSTLSILHRLR